MKKFAQIDHYRRVIEIFTLDQIYDEDLKAVLNTLESGEEIPFTGTTILKRLTIVR